MEVISLVELPSDPCHWPLLMRSKWLAPGGFIYNLKLVNFKLISTIKILSTFCEIAIRWMPQFLTDDKSTLLQVMAWCRQATSHYLSQCWPRSMSPYGVIRPQWVNAHFSFFGQQTVRSIFTDKSTVVQVIIGLGPCPKFQNTWEGLQYSGITE